MQCISADVCLWKRKKGTWRKHTVVITSSLIHITYGTHIKTKYMYMRFSNLAVDPVSPPPGSVWNLFIQLGSVVFTEGEGSSENLPLLWTSCADLGQTATETKTIHAGVVGFICLLVQTCQNSVLVFLSVTVLLRPLYCASIMEALPPILKRKQGTRLPLWWADTFNEPQ